MKTEELKKKFRERDRVYRVLSKNGHFRAVAIKNTEAAKTAQSNHNLDYISAFLLARTLSASSLLAAFLKGEERMIVEIEGNGPIGHIFAEALQVGEIRGYASIRDYDGLNNIQNISDALGIGLLKITRMLYHKNEPIQGIVPLQNGDVATDLAFYLTQSEQIPSAVVLDVDIDDNGKITQSGGLIIQAMPGATDDQIQKVYDSVSQLKSIVKYFEEGKSAEDLLRDFLPFDFDVVSSSPIDFFCRCSKEKFMDKLVTLNMREIQEMKNEGHDELVCQYCNNKYYLEDEDFDKLLEDIQAAKN